MNERLEQFKALIEHESDTLAVLANTSAFIFESMENLNWAGFYLLKDGELVLGPFQGKVACFRIPLSRGVCGYCAREQKSVIVPNVHEFDGHIACDSASNSELVVPLFKNQVLFGVIDIDSFKLNNFSQSDQQFIERIAELLSAKL